MNKCYNFFFKALIPSVLLGGFLIETAHAENSALTIHYAIPNYVSTVNDGSNIIIFGTVNIVESRDKHSGSIYKYAVLHTENPYRIREGEDIDDSNITPTTFIQLNQHSSMKEFIPYMGRYVKISGKISSTNGGGPMLDYNSISFAKNDD